MTFANDKLVLVDGIGDNFVSDTYRYENGEWTQLDLNLFPPLRSLFNMAVSSSGEILVVGGQNELGDPASLGEPWFLNSEWQRRVDLVGLNSGSTTWQCLIPNVRWYWSMVV